MGMWQTTLDSQHLKDCIVRHEWRKAKKILKEFPHSAKEQLSANEFRILWIYAPDQLVLRVLEAWPEAYQNEGPNGVTLVQAMMEKKRLDMLNDIFKRHPQVRDTLDVQKATSYGARFGAPFEFLNKHWGEISKLRYSIHNRNWNKVTKILSRQHQLAQQELSEYEFQELWHFAPEDVILVLLDAWKEAHKQEGLGGVNLVRAKMKRGEWDFLQTILQKYPHVIDTVALGEAVQNKAPTAFLQKYWADIDILLHCIHSKNWNAAIEILRNKPQVTAERMSKVTFEILWKEAPSEVLCALLRAVPDIHKQKDFNGNDLRQTKSCRREWGSLKSIVQEFPQILKETSKREFETVWESAPADVVRTIIEALSTASDNETSLCADLLIKNIELKKWDSLIAMIQEYSHLLTKEDIRLAYEYGDHLPIHVYESLLDKFANVLLDVPESVFDLIDKEMLEHFRAALKSCPTAAEVKQERTNMTPLLVMFCEKATMTADWIGTILQSNPQVATHTDPDGKTALHLAYQHSTSPEILEMIRNAHPEAENTRDNDDRLPSELADSAEQNNALIPFNQALLLEKNLPSDQISRRECVKYDEKAVAVSRGRMLMKDIELPQQRRRISYALTSYAAQIGTRQRIFKTLLSEFSEKVRIQNKDVIQKAATIQALASERLSDKDNTVINFELFDSSGYWYQQEVLKLVMRVYHECQTKVEFWRPSILSDAKVCSEHLDGTCQPAPSKDYAEAFQNLKSWLTDGLNEDGDTYEFQGPVLKPLQSLFNKMFIRRGQTSINVIGDLARATLLVDSEETLRRIVANIETTFPNITKENFRHPDKFDGLGSFLQYVHHDLKFVPNSTHALPYRFKPNSSQNERETPVWYNFNFFVQMPEYHRVGQSEIFVACELQIGLREEINKHRNDHIAYERNRILSSQPLLKNYDSSIKKAVENESSAENLVNSPDSDSELIKKVLLGNIAKEALVPCTNSDKSLFFESNPFSLSKNDFEADLIVKPRQLCLNNRSLNWYASAEAPSKVGGYAAVVAGPYELDGSKRYFVDTLEMEGMQGFTGNVGLYAHVGPYLVQVACSCGGKDGVIVESGRNLTYLEQICPIPEGTTALEVIVYGCQKNFGYGSLMLCLMEFDIQ